MVWESKDQNWDEAGKHGLCDVIRICLWTENGRHDFLGLVEERVTVSSSLFFFISLFRCVFFLFISYMLVASEKSGLLRFGSPMDQSYWRGIRTGHATS